MWLEFVQLVSQLIIFFFKGVNDVHFVVFSYLQGLYFAVFLFAATGTYEQISNMQVFEFLTFFHSLGDREMCGLSSVKPFENGGAWPF